PLAPQQPPGPWSPSAASRRVGLRGSSMNRAAAASRPVLEAAGLRKTYGGLTAVDGVSLSVGPGEIVGLVGPNGAGKTTTINMILGVLEPTAGSVLVDGLDIGTKRAQAIARTN